MDITTRPNRFDWRLPSSAAVLIAIVFIAMAFGGEGIEIFASLFLVAPILLLMSASLIIYAFLQKRRQSRLTLLVTLVTLWLASLTMFSFDARHDADVRTIARWLLFSGRYQAAVTSQPSSANGDFKHIEWDGWGGAVVGDTAMYLVFDPTDSLSTAAKKGRSGKFDGIPCSVPKVTRLQKDWYTVLFYTDDDWDHCEYGKDVPKS